MMSASHRKRDSREALVRWLRGRSSGGRTSDSGTFDCRSPILDCTPFPRFSIESRQSKSPKILALNIPQRFSVAGARRGLTRIRLQSAIYFWLHRGSLPENIARWQVCLSKDVFRRRLESVEREKLNPPAGLRASHEWMGDVSTIPEAGRQNPGSDKTPSSSAPQDSTQPDELEEVMSLETTLVRALQRHGAIW
jgi:hypothetical protein